MKTRIGILGGSFDPVHVGHLIAAQDAMQAFGLAGVLFVPCNRPAHKTTELASSVHRVAMLKRALKGNSLFHLSETDIRRGGITYSVETVRDLASERPDCELHFIIGSDTLLELHRWYSIGALLELCRFAVMARPGFDPDSMSERDIGLDPPWPRRLLQSAASGHRVDISSSGIRQRVAGGMSIKYLVPPEIEAYIAGHGLYRYD